ncbi:MAG: hypothetical protein IKE43_11665 [Coriobacteriales bacterium]|nr:hypothetical protein [Coriobacteriales bacterium]
MNLFEHCCSRILTYAFALAVCLVLALGIVSPAFANTSGREFRDAAKQEFLIPGLDTSFVPQGLSYDERSDAFFIGGYAYDSSADPIYMVDRASGEPLKVVYLLDPKGDAQTSHGGGLLVHGDYVYLAGSTEACLYVYDYHDIIAASDGAQIACLGSIPLGTTQDTMRISWVSSTDDALVVGEFNYTYLSFYRIGVEAGYNDNYGLEYRARAAFFTFSDSEDSRFGIEQTPSALLYLPDKTQGFAYDDNTVYISTSRLLGRGRILVYDLSAAEKVDVIKSEDGSIPVYVLGVSALLNKAVSIPMAEEIEIVDERLYIISEGASKLFFVGPALGCQWCYSVDLEFLMQ